MGRMLQEVFAAPLPPAPRFTSADWGPRAEPGHNAGSSSR